MTETKRNMAVSLEQKEVRIQTSLQNSPKRAPLTSVTYEFDSLGPRYRLREILSSDKGEDKER